jgi:hypothetical protein
MCSKGMVVMRARWAAATAAGILVVAGCTSGSGDVSGVAASRWDARIPVAQCPPGSTPDQPGPADQAARPGWHIVGSAMDSQSGRLVVVADAGVTFTFDVCTNTWQQIMTLHSPDPPYLPYRLAYDPIGDVVLAVTVVPTTAPEAVRRAVSGPPATTDAFVRVGDPVPAAAVLGVWAYSVDSKEWTQLASAWFPVGFEPTTFENVVFDPGTRRVLMLIGSGAEEGPKDLSLWAYDEVWHGLAQVGGEIPISPPSARPRLSLDLAARQLVLALIDEVTAGQTWTFDLGTNTWTDQHAQPPLMYITDFGEGTTFDPIAHKTVAYGENGILATYRTGDDHWDVVAPGPGWPPHGTFRTRLGTEWTGALARYGQSLVYDPVNQRILMVGGHHIDNPGAWGGPGSRDVWAYDLPTNTWTELVHSTS